MQGEIFWFTITLGFHSFSLVSLWRSKNPILSFAPPLYGYMYIWPQYTLEMYYRGWTMDIGHWRVLVNVRITTNCITKKLPFKKLSFKYFCEKISIYAKKKEVSKNKFSKKLLSNVGEVPYCIYVSDIKIKVQSNLIDSYQIYYVVFLFWF